MAHALAGDGPGRKVKAAVFDRAIAGDWVWWLHQAEFRLTQAVVGYAEVAPNQSLTLTPPWSCIIGAGAAGQEGGPAFRLCGQIIEAMIAPDGELIGYPQPDQAHEADCGDGGLRFVTRLEAFGEGLGVQVSKSGCQLCFASVKPSLVQLFGWP